MKWRYCFTVPNCNFNLVAYAPSAFINNIPKKDGVQLFKEWYIEYDGINKYCNGIVSVPVMQEMTNWIKDKIITDPDWVEKIHAEAEKMNWDYFNYANEIQKKDLSQSSNAELYEMHKTLRQHQNIGHTHAIATTWFVDSDQEVFSNYLRGELKKHLEKMAITDQVKNIEYFVILTSPSKKTMTQEEQLDFLELLKIIQNKFDKELPDFETLPEEIKKAILDHYEKWRWTAYGYLGPAYDLNFYLKQIKESLAKIFDIDKLIAEEKERNEKIRVERERVEKEINLPPELSRVFSIAREIIWLKDFRKNTIFHGHFVMDVLTKEISKRLQITHAQANHFLVEELKDALLNGNFDEHLLNARIKYCVIWADENTEKYYYGEEARKIIGNLDMEELKVEDTGEYKGTTACPGKVCGAVKIVNSVEDIEKVKDGDILLAQTTYPAYLPAMKRAAAIVTEDGGITCHAAIVAREFKIPCVVGVKRITKILKEGDQISVDATNCVIKRI